MIPVGGLNGGERRSLQEDKGRGREGAAPVRPRKGGQSQEIKRPIQSKISEFYTEVERGRQTDETKKKGQKVECSIGGKDMGKRLGKNPPLKTVVIIEKNTTKNPKSNIKRGKKQSGTRSGLPHTLEEAKERAIEGRRKARIFLSFFLKKTGTVEKNEKT